MMHRLSRSKYQVARAFTSLLFLFGLFGSVVPLPVAAQTAPLCCKCTKAGQDVCVNVTLPAGESAGADCSGLTGTQTYRNMVGDRQALFEGFRCSAVLDAQGCTPVGTNASSQCPVGTPINLEALPARFTATTAGQSASGDVRATPAEQPFQPVVPVLGVQIPGLTFTPASRENNVVTVSYLAEYINAGYRYLVGVIMVIAIIMVVWGGFRFLLGSANVGNISKAKETIRDAIVGMLLVIGAFVILETINPATTELRSLELSSTVRQEFNLDLHDVTGETIDATDFQPTSQGGTGSGSRGPYQGCFGQTNAQFPRCPISLTSPVASGADPNGKNCRTDRNHNDPRTAEFEQRVGGYANGTPREKVIKVAQAAVSCGISFGACGRSVSQIFRLAGVQEPSLQSLPSSVTAQMRQLILSCPTTDRDCRNRLRPQLRALVASKQREWVDRLQPGDRVQVYTGTVANAGSSSVYGMHATLFLGWVNPASKSRAKVIQGQYGYLVSEGTMCLGSGCGDTSIMTGYGAISSQ